MKALLHLFLFLGLTLNVGAQDKSKISNLLDKWHEDAAQGNYESYFSAFDSSSVFIGTDKTENWQVSDFKKWSKKYFEDGEAWSFKSTERNIYFAGTKNIAWFDELLDTWMGVCRGSGVVQKIDGEWKIKHYVLSVTIDNDKIQDFINITKEQNDK